MRLIQLELGSGRAVARVDGAKPAIVPGYYLCPMVAP